ncbi:hypothetical protein KFF05_03930 [bacterium SCSIO 12827]|nr:hypothetical protein KFF05_03930 [bacterium SCSIO 12827]
MSKSDYVVGYKKPPTHSQFKPRQSGNPKGRPKGTKNLATDLQEELTAKIVVREGAREQKISKQRALVKTLFNNALKGDIRAINAFLRLIERTHFEEVTELNSPEISQDDEAIIDAFIMRHQARNLVKD